MLYFGLLILLILCQLFYFKIAEKYNIIDIPNERSSHNSITLRGGGIIFPIATFIAFLTHDVTWPVMLAIVIVSIISFIDDINPVNLLPRFLVHILAVVLLLFDLKLFNESFILLSIIAIMMIGWINAFNFMDGINGITVLYTSIAIISFGLLEVNKDEYHLLLVVGSACIVFGFFNVRKIAKTFAGDVGSISLAVFLGFLMMKTIKETNQIGFILFFSVYGVDSCFTIINRLIKGENILKGHRTHLYQFLANEFKIVQIKISSIYAFIQLIINLSVIHLFNTGKLDYLTISIYIIFISVIYILIRIYVLKKINYKTLIANK